MFVCKNRQTTLIILRFWPVSSQLKLSALVYHIKTMIENTTAIFYINNMGGRTISCNWLTRNLWLWCNERNLWITAAHIPGKLNVIADTESTKTYQDTEWKLDPLVFNRTSSFWSKHSIERFASRLVRVLQVINRCFTLTIITASIFLAHSTEVKDMRGGCTSTAKRFFFFMFGFSHTLHSDNEKEFTG